MASLEIEHPFVKNPFSAEMLSLFDMLRHKKKVYGVASCLLLTGESGSGKSGLADYYAKNNPIQEQPERTFIPVLHYELVSVSTPEEFLKSLLVEIGDPQLGLGGRNKKDLLYRLIKLIKVTGVELLILDEIQGLIERRRSKVISGIADLFKDLIKKTEVPIVFMGMPWTRYLVDSNPQLKRRIKYRHEIPDYKFSEKTARNDYRKLLKLLGNHYLLTPSIQLEDLDMALRIFSFTSGNLRDTVDLVRDAYIYSQMNDSKINRNLFAEVLKTYGVPDNFNMFIMPIDKLEIRELIKGSDWDFGKNANRNAIVDAEYAVFGVTEEKKLYGITGAA
tara:strand:+ start:2654 stop:3655 length:1002 start_codon:yes stop_codon:yes gene_type:complete